MARRLTRAARAAPGPATALLAPVPPGLAWARHAAPRPDPSLRRCRCGRLTERRWCCWVCMTALDGGWILGPWNPRARWTDVHTQGCEMRRIQRDPAAAYLAAAWHAGSAPPPGRRL